jgi:hypothetical protein
MRDMSMAGSPPVEHVRAAGSPSPVFETEAAALVQITGSPVADIRQQEQAS